ncbi:hypothetical protein OAR04_04470 [Flavobacteriales bacterium]|nr:hypothetical protein [Flavobacteriales bacterium]
MKKLLLILICLPIIGFGQDDCGDKPIYKGNKFNKKYKTTKAYKDYKKNYKTWIDCRGGNTGDCKFYRNELDDMTGIYIAETKSKSLYTTFIGDNVFFHFRYASGFYYLMLDITKHNSFSISKGNKLLVKFDTDEVLEFEFLNTEFSNLSYYSQYVSTYQLANSVSISRDDLVKLTTNKIKKVRIYGNDGYFEKDDIKDKGANNFITDANCILNLKINKDTEPKNKF